MAHRRKRKIPMPDWIGVPYKGKNKDETGDKSQQSKQEQCGHSSTEADVTTSTIVNKPTICSSEKLPKDSSSKRSKIANTSAGGSMDKDVQLSAEDVIRLSLPLLKFSGSVIYSYNASDCSMLCEDLMSQFSGEDKWHVGFDMEWPVYYRSGVTEKVALIQICISEEKCYLFHIAAMGTLPKALKLFLSHKQMIKYGINIVADFWKLARDFDIQVLTIIDESVKDLSKIANEKLKSAENWSLDGLTRNVFRKRLDKEGAMRCGTWDQYPLSEEQIEYAAADAFASFLLANHLRKK